MINACVISSIHYCTCDMIDSEVVLAASGAEDFALKCFIEISIVIWLVTVRHTNSHQRENSHALSVRLTHSLTRGTWMLLAPSKPSCVGLFQVTIVLYSGEFWGMFLFHKWMKIVSKKTSTFGWFLFSVKSSSLYGWKFTRSSLYRDQN